MGPLHDPVTWYKIIYTGEQVAQWDFQNNATRTSSPGPAFVLEVPLRNLLTSIYNFVPCDWVVQRAHWLSYPPWRLFGSAIVLLFLRTNKPIRMDFLSIFLQDFRGPRKVVFLLKIVRLKSAGNHGMLRAKS